MISFVKIILNVVRFFTGAKKYGDFDFGLAAMDLHNEGIAMRASGILLPDDDNPIGIYIVRYGASIKENRYGRYN